MIQIGERQIGPGHPIFIAVEAGSTCNGDLVTALKMADAAKESGADAIKWQMINPDELMSDKSVEYTYEWAGGTNTENMYEMFKAMMFTPAQWQQVVEHCDRIKLPWYASVDYIAGVDLAEQLGCPMYKLSSWDARNFPLIRCMAKTGKPIQVDLGPASEAEIKEILREVKRNNIILVHCTHATSKSEFNMRTISYIRSKIFGLGWSSEGRDWIPDFLAIGQRVCLIEKRLTLNNRHKGHHHMKALEPHEFKAWVDMVRSAESMMGQYAIKPSIEDLRQKELYFTSIVAARDIRQGEIITEAMLCAKRPGHGISPLFMDRFIGKVAQYDIDKDGMLTWQDVS